MKHLCVIGIAVLLAFVSCTSKVKVPESVEGPTPELSTIDSLMWHRPDSAFALLLDFASSPKADSLDVFNGHYCQVLISELLYKNDYEQSNRPDLLEAVVYFDSLLLADTRGVSLRESGRRNASHTSAKNAKNAAPTSAFLDARAHYINGVGYYEQGDMVQACAEYLKTLEVMEEYFGEKELVGHKARFMTYTYNRLGDMFSEQFMMESAITCYENALVYCKIEPTSPTGISNILSRLGLQYDKLGNKEKTREYYGQAIEELPSSENLIYRDLVTSKALSDYQLGLGIEQSLEVLRQVLANTNDEGERLARFLTIGAIFVEEGMYDSAMYYLEPVFENGEDRGSQIQAAECLRIIYDSIGDNEKLDRCLHFLALQKKSEGQNKALVSQLEDLFKAYMNKKMEKQAEESREKAIKKVMGILIPIAVIVALAILIFAKLRGKKLLQDKEKHHKQEIESERQSHRMQQAALSGRLKKSHEEVRELKDQIQQQYDRMAKAEFAASFTEEPVCRLIMDRVNEGQFKSKVDYTIYKDSALDKQQLLDLRLAADRHFGQFTSRLKKAYPELTNTDLDYCCLYLLGLTDADIAALMQRKYNTVFERNGKIRKIFGNENPLPVTLTGIANGFLSA